MNDQMFFLTIFVLCSSFEVPNMYFKFQQLWPGSVCLEKQCHKEFIGQYKGNTWAIHGLWPGARQRDGQCKILKYCTSKKFRKEFISEETNISLDETWVGLYKSTEKFRAYQFNLFSHEWNRHGTCWNQNDDLFEQKAGMSNQEEYFITTYELLEIYNIYHILKHAGITPDNFYYTGDILSAIKLNIKVEAQLHCVEYKNQLLLHSISLCFDEIYRPINCPCKRHALHCGENQNDQVLYPLFKL